ncbi:MAG TPA: DUF2017 family protein [Actinomycetota bacterium]|nr:DUF2017 family protein [Actinomycetota bacterium]
MPTADHPRIARVAPGRFAVSLPRPERLILRSLLSELRSLVEDRDPTTRRLFPVAYPNDPDKEAEYQSMMSGELVESRLAAIETVKSTLSHKQIDAAALERWMEAINSLRLVLGTRLDVTEELPVLDADDPDAPAYAMYDYLGWLLEQAVHAQMEDLV